MKIIMICKNNFLLNNSGINTFITHMETMCNKLNIKYEIITENYVEKINHENILYVNSFNNCVELLYERYKDENNVYITDGLDTLQLVDKLSIVLSQGTFIYYTHIGDIIHDDPDNYDFSIEEKEITLNILENNNNIIIGTQSEELKSHLLNIFSKEKVICLPEPLYIIKPEIDNLKIYDVCSIMNNTKRKKIKKVVDLCEKLNISLNLITSGFLGYLDIKKLLNTTQCKMNLLEKVPNKNIPSCVALSKLLIHFSDVEVFPYSILETASIVPVIINNNSLWGQLFPDNLVYKVDYNNEEECKKLINNLLINPIPKMDLLDYQNKCENIWKQFITGGENEL